MRALERIAGDTTNSDIIRGLAAAFLAMALGSLRFKQAQLTTLTGALQANESTRYAYGFTYRDKNPDASVSIPRAIYIPTRGITGNGEWAAPLDTALVGTENGRFLVRVRAPRIMQRQLTPRHVMVVTRNER